MKVRDLCKEDDGKIAIVTRIAEPLVEKELKLVGKTGKLEVTYLLGKQDTIVSILIKEDGYGWICLDIKDEVEFV